MRVIGATVLGFLALLTPGLAGSSAMAGPKNAPNASHLSLQYPGAPRRIYNDPKTPYAMNYTDQMAQGLGVRDGKMDVFSSQPAKDSAFIPRLSGGVGGDGAMVKLQWHPGE